MKKETGKSAMSKGKAKKHAPVHGMHVRRGAGGGYIVKHDVQPDMSEMQAGAVNPMGAAPSPEYPIANQAALHQHIDEHMPEQSEETEDGAAGGAGAGAGM